MAFSDNYSTASLINAGASANYLTYTADWQVVSPSRSNGGNKLSEQFDSLSGWSSSTGGTSTIDITSGGFLDPAIGNVVRLKTGTTQNSLCVLSKVVSSIPSTFGVQMQFALPSPSLSWQDSARVFIQNTVNNKYFEMLICGAGIIIAQDGGSYLFATAHYNPFWEQWWEIKDNGDGTHDIELWGGTELWNTWTINLPTGSSGNAGLVQIQQNSGANASQEFLLAQLNIGTTQLPDDLFLQSVAYTAPYQGTAVNCMMFVEDTCNNTVIGADFGVEISIDGGQYWTSLSVQDLGEFCKGIIDYTKSVRMVKAVFTGSVPKGAQIILRQKTANGKFMVLTGYHIQITSIY